MVTPLEVVVELTRVIIVEDSITSKATDLKTSIISEELDVFTESQGRSNFNQNFFTPQTSTHYTISNCFYRDDNTYEAHNTHTSCCFLQQPPLFSLKLCHCVDNGNEVEKPYNRKHVEGV